MSDLQAAQQKYSQVAADLAAQQTELTEVDRQLIELHDVPDNQRGKVPNYRQRERAVTARRHELNAAIKATGQALTEAAGELHAAESAAERIGGE